MRRLALVLFLLALPLAAFGGWGLHTAAGRRAFDEMAGMLPLAAAWGSLLLAVLALLLALWPRRPRGG